MISRLSGLYAITDSQLLPGDKLYGGVAAAIAGGARIIQYRDKNNDRQQRHQTARQLLTLCREQDILLIINDDVALAAEIGADGVHLGKDDTDLHLARQMLGKAIIGVSCYNDWQQAEVAHQSGADYIAFGAFYPSATKPNAVTADKFLLQRAKQELNLPVVAIGGITTNNGAELIEAGADMLAVVQGVFAQKDIRQAATEYAQLFNQQNIINVKDAI